MSYQLLHTDIHYHKHLRVMNTRDNAAKVSCLYLCQHNTACHRSQTVVFHLVDAIQEKTQVLKAVHIRKSLPTSNALHR